MGTSDKGIVVVVSGPSGVGKSTLCQALVERLDGFLSVSATTRAKRALEQEGREYHFISADEFDRRVAAGEFLETAEVYGGHRYGTPAGPVREALEAGRAALLEIEIHGAIQVRKAYPDMLGIYVLAPGPQQQQERITGRKQDSAEAIRERLSKADGEIAFAQESGCYQHFVINDVFEETIDRMEQLIRQEQANR
jgi:guanylate kinase